MDSVEAVATPQQLRTVRWTGAELVTHLDAATDVYAAAMSYDPQVMRWRRGYMAAHARQPDFRAVATFQDHLLVGFGYGYRSTPGHWWHEQVRAAIWPREYQRWMAHCFELIELHVAPQAQGHGSGERQLRMLLDDVPCATVLLSTPEVAAPEPESISRAWRLYRRLGFEDLARGYHFAGDKRPFGVLGRDLPLE